jgi:Domain of unknown function (DUF4188)
MPIRVNRQTVDLSNYPNLVVIYLGMRVNSLRGLARLSKVGPQIQKSAAATPEGLLRHENLLFGLLPLHVGIRQYWRDFESLENWTRTLPHQGWWKEFLRESGGTGFWHEAYFMRGGMEAIYDDIPVPLGFGTFAAVKIARGPMFSARQRLDARGEPASSSVVSEDEAYGVG